MILRSLLLSAFVLLSSIIGGAPRSLAATDDPASFVNDLGTRALAAMRNGDTAAVQGRFRQLFRQYFDAEACARSALGPHWQNTTAPQRQEYANRYKDYIVIVYSRIASPEMFPEAEMLPHLICSRPVFIGGAKDEADQHGGA